jgi:RNA polymerase sigma factor (sigma-70 family)
MIQGLTRRFAGSLTPEQLTAAGDMALWRCLQSYDPSYGQKVASSLYRFINWECLRTIQEQQTETVSISGDVEGESESISIHLILDDYLSMLSHSGRRIVEARFLENRTLDEIARVEGYSKQGIKDIVDRSIEMMSEAALAA